MNGEEITDLALLKVFRRCAHLQHRMGRFHGQGYLLILLWQKGRMTQRELSDITQRRSATLSEQLETLEQAGLITREKNSEDKRNVDVLITEAGARMALEAEREREKIATLLFSGLCAQDRASLYGMLESLSARWQTLDTQEGSEEKA